MPRDLLLPTLAGVAAGLVVALLAVALWIRRQRRAADGIVARAQKESSRIRAEAARDAESAKTEMLVGARMETLKLREEPQHLGLLRVRDLDGDGRSDLMVVEPRPSPERGVTAPARLDLYLSGGAS